MKRDKTVARRTRPEPRRNFAANSKANERLQQPEVVRRESYIYILAVWKVSRLELVVVVPADSPLRARLFCARQRFSLV